MSLERSVTKEQAKEYLEAYSIGLGQLFTVQTGPAVVE